MEEPKDFEHMARWYAEQLTAAQLRALAGNLGVSTRSLRRLGAGWNAVGYTFPMRNESGRIIGLHVRYPAGSKVAEKGSRNGLFIPDGLPANGILLVCEGVTDTAAGLDLGLPAVGRPSCNGGGRMLKVLARHRAVVIVGDNDLSNQPGKMPPGQRGAESLARSLALHCTSVRIVYPPSGVKDLRQWRAAGLTPSQMKDAILAAKPVRLTVGVTNRARKRRHDHGR